MKSFPKRKIIKNAEVDGIIFCSPSGSLGLENSGEKQEQEQLQALEQFWKSKGIQEGKKEGYEEGLKIGEEKGFKKGLEKGKEDGIKEGREKALEQGSQKGYQKAKEELQELITVFEQLSTKVTQQGSEFLDQFKNDIVSLCMTISEKIIRKELSSARSLENLIETLLLEAKSMITEEAVDIHLSKEDYQCLESSKDKLKNLDISIKHLQFHADSSVKQGNFSIVTSKGLMNFDVNRLLNDLNTHILEVASSPEEIFE